MCSNNPIAQYLLLRNANLHLYKHLYINVCNSSQNLETVKMHFMLRMGRQIVSSYNGTLLRKKGKTHFWQYNNMDELCTYANMHSKRIMISERRQTPEVSCYRILFIWCFGKGKTVGIKTPVVRDWG